MKSYRSHICLAVAILAALMPAACATGGRSGSDGSGELTDKVQTRIKPLVEALYLNARELKEIYRDLRSVAQAHALRGDDLQLNYVQKTTLYVQKTHQSAFNQWEMLSIMEDIRASAVKDYYTLRRKALGQALNEAVYDERFIKIYQTRITNADAQKDIDNALEILAANREIYSQLMEAIAPLVRRSEPAELL